MVEHGFSDMWYQLSDSDRNVMMAQKLLGCNIVTSVDGEFTCGCEHKQHATHDGKLRRVMDTANHIPQVVKTMTSYGFFLRLSSQLADNDYPCKCVGELDPEGHKVVYRCSFVFTEDQESADGVFTCEPHQAVYISAMLTIHSLQIERLTATEC